MINFDLQFISGNERFCQVQNSAELAGCQAMLGVIPKPNLELNQRRLAFSAPAIHKILCNMADFRHMEVDQDQLAVRQNEVNQLVRILAQQGFERVESHRLINMPL